MTAAKGSSSNGTSSDIAMMEINGVKYIPAEKAEDYLEAQGSSSKAAAALLEEKLASVQQALTEKERENGSMRQMMRDSERANQSVKAKEREREEEMQTLRTRISVTTKQLSIAQVNEKNAVDVAVKMVEQDVAQKYSEGRDQQLAKMRKALATAVANAHASEDTAASKVTSAESAVLTTAEAAVSRVDADATAAVTLARAQAEVAQQAASAAAASAAAARKQLNATTRSAEQLFSEASRASDRASTAYTESVALQKEVKALREGLQKAVAQRDAGLKIAADRQAYAVWQMRTTREQCEGRIQEMHNAYEGLKHEEREGARQAREHASELSKKCEHLEAQEREGSAKQQELHDSLEQAKARAAAAEDRVTKRRDELEAEKAHALEALKAAATSDLEGAKAAALAEAEQAAQAMISKAQAEVERAQAAAAKERTALEAAAAGATAEVDHWKARSEQKNLAVKALERDIAEVLKVLPKKDARLKLKLESSISEQDIIAAEKSGSDDVATWPPPRESLTEAKVQGPVTEEEAAKPQEAAVSGKE